MKLICPHCRKEFQTCSCKENDVAFTGYFETPEGKKYLNQIFCVDKYKSLFLNRIIGVIYRHGDFTIQPGKFKLNLAPATNSLNSQLNDLWCKGYGIKEIDNLEERRLLREKIKHEIMHSYDGAVVVKADFNSKADLLVLRLRKNTK